MAMDGLRNTVPCTPGRGVGVVTTIVAAASRGYILPVWLKKSSIKRVLCLCTTYIGKGRGWQVLLERGQLVGSLHG